MSEGLLQLSIPERIKALGIVDDKTNVSVGASLRLQLLENKLPSEQFLALHPDHIDNGEFWRHIDSEFSNSVCGDRNGVTAETKSIDLINSRNLGLALQMGVFNYLVCAAPSLTDDLRLLEIGPGYGNIKKFLDAAPYIKKLDYTGVDVAPKFEGVLQCKPDGTMPDEAMTKKYNYVLSSNVFQHLSRRQTYDYFYKIGQVLEPGGMFSLTAICGNNDGEILTHYGQLLPMFSPETLEGALAYFGFRKWQMIRRNDCVTTFHCYNTRG